jgi:hypothetical protein
MVVELSLTIAERQNFKNTDIQYDRALLSERRGRARKRFHFINGQRFASLPIV